MEHGGTNPVRGPAKTAQADDGVPEALLKPALRTEKDLGLLQLANQLTAACAQALKAKESKPEAEVDLEEIAKRWLWDLKRAPAETVPSFDSCWLMVNLFKNMILFKLSHETNSCGARNLCLNLGNM